MRRVRIGAVVALWTALAAMTLSSPAAASSWTLSAWAGSAGEAQAQGLPVPSPAAACQSANSKVIVVTWAAIAHGGYTIYESTTTAGGTYTSVAAGITAGTWSSGSLADGNYWFKVAGFIGANWASGQSAATGETTVQNGSTKCTQP